MNQIEIPAVALPAGFVQVGMFTNKVERARCIWWDEVAQPEGTPIYIGTPAAQAERQGPGMVSVKREDANNYCKILRALGMEEEGDPVAEVERLFAQQSAEPVALPAEPVATLSYTPVIAGLPVLRLTELGRRWVQGGVFSLYATPAAQLLRRKVKHETL